MKIVTSLIAGFLCLLSMGPARVGELAPDFSPGVFLDGKNYSLRDYEGKVIVLIFYDAECSAYRGSIPERTKLIDKYHNRPIKFFAIAAGDSVADARAYAKLTGQNLPTFVDNVSLLERRYGATVSRTNGMQVRIIGGDGKLLAARELTADALDTALDDARYKYKGQGYDPKLDPAIDCFEAGQYAEGMKLLKPLLRNARKKTAESARKLCDAVREEGLAWLTRADEAVQEKPVDAYDLYQKVVVCFAGEDLGKRAGDGVKKVAGNPMVKDELAARQMWQRLTAGIINARAADRDQVKDFAAEIARKYSKTPTGEKAAEIVKELM